jgi:hypothetical protein
MQRRSFVSEMPLGTGINGVDIRKEGRSGAVRSHSDGKSVRTVRGSILPLHVPFVLAQTYSAMLKLLGMNFVPRVSLFVTFLA